MITLVKTVLLNLEQLQFRKKTFFQIVSVKSQRKLEISFTHFKQSIFCKGTLVLTLCTEKLRSEVVGFFLKLIY